MKKFNLILTISLFLTSCTSATPQTIIIPTETLTNTPTPTPNPSSTPHPTFTSTPSIPETIKFEFDDRVPENIVEMVRVTTNQAYWYYVDLGCSPKFYRVIVTRDENALTLDTDGIKVGWDDLNTDISSMSTRVSHEMFHVMCQLAIQEDPNTGLDLLWLLEGNANYVVAMERIQHTGMLTGVEQTIDGHSIGMAQWVSESFCEISLERLEKGDERKVTPYFGAIDEVAASMLVNISPDGINSFIHYYQLRPKHSREVAFELAFGITLNDFYQMYQSECEAGFPSIYKNLPTPIPLEGTIRIQGNVTAENISKIYDQYFIVPCKLKVDINFINIDKCQSGVFFNPDGSFVLDLTPGSYYFSINPTDGGEALGWYAEDGLVSEPTCAQIFKTNENQSISIKIDPKNIRFC